MWRFQIPEQIQEKWNYPAITERDKRNILGLNSARHYGLFGREVIPVGARGSAYWQGNLAVRGVHAARQRHRRRAAGRWLPNAGYPG